MAIIPAKHTLLVIDDEPNICASVHDLLRREFHVLTATSAAEGGRIMSEHDVHIIMTDQRMPHTTGVELLTSVRTEFPQAVRILFTGFADVEAIIAAINQGHIFQFIKKPWAPETLEEAIRAAAAEHDRIVEQIRETLRLKREVDDLRLRVNALERDTSRDPSP